MPETAQRLVWLWIPVNRLSSKNDSSHTWHTCEKRFIVNPIFGPHPFEAVLQCRRTLEQPTGGICGMSIRCVQSHVFFPTGLSPHQATIQAPCIETYTLLTQGFLKDMSLRFLTSSISWYILQHSCNSFFLNLRPQNLRLKVSLPAANICKLSGNIPTPSYCRCFSSQTRLCQSNRFNAGGQEVWWGQVRGSGILWQFLSDTSSWLELGWLFPVSTEELDGVEGFWWFLSNWGVAIVHKLSHFCMYTVFVCSIAFGTCALV